MSLIPQLQQFLSQWVGGNRPEPMGTASSSQTRPGALDPEQAAVSPDSGVHLSPNLRQWHQVQSGADPQPSGASPARLAEIKAQVQSGQYAAITQDPTYCQHLANRMIHEWGLPRT